MKIKKIAAILLSLLLIICLIPASVFATTAPDPEDPSDPEETPTVFTITGWDGYASDGVILSVNVNGEEIPEFGAAVTAAPGETLEVEVELADGYELYQYPEDDSYFWWEYDMTVDNIGWCIAGTTPTQVTLPGEDLLALTDELTLCFDTQFKLTAITSVSIDAPEIKEGEGYTVEEIQEDEYTYYESSPAPVVTIPDDAPYVAVYAGWAQESDDPDDMYGLGYTDAYEDVVFEKDTDYYLYVYLVAKDIYGEGGPKGAEGTRAIGPDGLRLFSVDNPPEITIKNGELVDYVIPSFGPEKAQTRAISGPASAEMLVLVKVNIPSPAPSTSDINPSPWVWTMIVALTLVLTTAYYEIEDLRKFSRR